MRRAARRDDNEQEIVAALREVVDFKRTCFQCGSQFVPKTCKHIKYCTPKCLHESRHARSLGDKNPNYKNSATRSCLTCKITFKSYNKTRKYCSNLCYTNDRYKNSKSSKTKTEKKQRALQTKKCSHCGKEFRCSHSNKKTTCSTECALQKRLAKRQYKTCLHCGNLFQYYQSQSKRYCTYKCHIESGGSFRAGLAASKAKMRYGAKRDANHDEVMTELRKHCAVYDLSNAGNGIPDGVAWINNAWHLFDIKNPKTAYGRRGLNPVQKKWISMWPGGPVYLIYSAEEAARFAQGDFSGIKFFRGELSANASKPEGHTDGTEMTLQRWEQTSVCQEADGQGAEVSQ